MSNLSWYILLAIIGLCINIPTIIAKRKVFKVSTLLTFYLSMAGFTWIGEFVVLGLFNSYAYKTGVFSNPWAQDLLGHLILNTTLYPAAAILIAVYNLKFRWILVISGAFVLIECLFLKLGLYEHHWWRCYMTAVIMVIFLTISKYWFGRMNKMPFGATRAITFYFASMVVIHIPAPVLLLLGKQYYTLGFIDRVFKDSYLSSIVITFGYHLAEVFLFVLFVCILKDRFWKAVPFFLSAAAQIAFAKMNILIFTGGWSLVHTLLIYELFIAGAVVLEKYSLKPESAGGGSIKDI